MEPGDLKLSGFSSHSSWTKLRCLYRLGCFSSTRSSRKDLVPETQQRPLLKLRFINSPARCIVANSSINDEYGSPIAIELIDAATNARVNIDRRVKIVGLYADINGKSLTTADFDRNIVRPRKGKRPLLVGDLTVTLKDGFGVISSDIVVTDNSSWLRGRKFRLGAKAMEGVVVKAISEAFFCTDSYVEAYRKHFPPYPDSEVWRLVKIPKHGKLVKRLAQAGIHTVKDLRRYLAIHFSDSKHEIILQMSEKRWSAIVYHLMDCVSEDSEYYMYNSKKSHRAFLLFNSFYEVIKVSFDGITFLNNFDLTSKQQETLVILEREAYENIDCFLAVDFSKFPPGSSTRLEGGQLSFHIPKPQGIIIDERSDFNSVDVYEPLDKCDASSASTDYDVVIRYRRGDVSNNDFISHLLAAFCRKGISVHEDFDKVDEVPKCKVLIIFLTTTYVPSNLLTILEHRQKQGLVVYPLFDGISPSDLITSSENYKRFFLQHEPKCWQAALKEIAQIAGYILTDRSESELIDEIIGDALKVISSIDKKKMIGMDAQVEEILSLLCIESLDVRSVGIWGTVGIGKTAIAEEIFRRISVQYETCVFVRDLHKEVQEKGQDAVREYFLSRVSEVEPHVIRFSDMKESFLRNRLRRKKVLVILDNVNDFRDVETFLGKLNYFGPGSRIIITSRNRHVFVLCKIDNVYEVKPLDISNSLLLLECGMFESVLSPGPSRTLSLELVRFSSGNPLVLQFLRNSVRERIGLSQQNQKFSIHYIQDIFERNGLDDNERSLFLDIACFFRKMDKDYVAMLLDDCSFSAHVGFRSLVDKALLTISHNVLDMLRFIQETGRETVRQESKSPEYRSRLFDPEDIMNVFIHDKCTSAIEGIFLDMSKLKFDVNPKIFEQMCSLRLLKIYCSKVIENHGVVSLPQGLEYLPSKLRLLHWENYPLSSLPRSFDPKNLVELNLPSSCSKKLWKGKKNLEKLRKMRLSYSYQLTKVPRLSNAPNLEHIDLEGCTSLVSISHSISCLKKLVFLNLKDCSKLENIPSTFDLESLEVLNLSGCSKLENFPEISPSVKELYLSGTMIQEIPSSIKNLVLLEILDLENNRHLVNLPTSICKLKNLETLNLSGCTSLERFPDLSRRMKCLKSLDLSKTAIREVPSSISYLTALEELRFIDCRNLVRLPDNAWSLSFKVEFRQLDTEKFARLWNKFGWLKKVQVS